MDDFKHFILFSPEIKMKSMMSKASHRTFYICIFYQVANASGTHVGLRSD